MNKIPNNLKYTRTHEWANTESAEITVGITDHAQQLLGDIVFVKLPEIGQTINIADEVGVIESVKAAADFYSPVSGEITAINDALLTAPEKINQDPYQAGWLFKIKSTKPAELEELLDADGYTQLIAED